MNVWKNIAWTALAMLVMISPVAVAQAQVASRGPMQDAINNLLDPIRWATVDAMDVAGVKLDMTPEQARSALVAKGFKPIAADPDQPSWASRISEKVLERGKGVANRSTVPMFTMANGPQGERIEVWYTATVDGARAGSIKYSIPSNRMEPSNFLANVELKYGRATFQEKNQRVYCAKGRDSRSSCLLLGNIVDRPGLVAITDYSFYTISLMEGSARADGRKQLFEAEVEAKAPKNGVASF